jgi:hypothetical protein
MSIIALEDEYRMMMRHQWAPATQRRINGQKDQETVNACGTTRTSVKGWGEQCNKGEYLICTLHFDFLNAILVPKTPLGITSRTASVDEYRGSPGFIRVSVGGQM